MENTDRECCYDCGGPMSKVIGVFDDDGNPASECTECQDMTEEWGDSVVIAMSDAREQAKRSGQPWDKKEWLKTIHQKLFHGCSKSSFAATPRLKPR